MHQRTEHSGRRARKGRGQRAPRLPTCVAARTARSGDDAAHRARGGGKMRGRRIPGLTCVQCLSERPITKGKEYVNTWAARCTSAEERIGRKDAIAGGTTKDGHWQ